MWNVGKGKLTTTAGAYWSSQNNGNFVNVATSVQDLGGPNGTSQINVSTAAGVPLTQNGIYAYGIGLGLPLATGHEYYDVNYKTLAPFGSVNYQIGRLAIGGSLRYDTGRVRGAVNSAGYGGGRVGQTTVDMNRDGTISLPETKVAILPVTPDIPVHYNYHYVSYSAGVNYRLAEDASVFARYSRGARAAGQRVLTPGLLNPTTGSPLSPDLAYGAIKQAEAGVKFRRANLSVYLTAFWAKTEDRTAQVVYDAVGHAQLEAVVRTYSAKGIEFEGDYRNGPFSIALGATYTKAKIDNDPVTPALNGNRPRHTPELMFQARPELDFGKVGFGSVIYGRTGGFAQDDNVLKQPGYVLVSPFVQVHPTDRLLISVNAFNVFNKLALISPNGSAVPASGLSSGMIANGRAVTASASLSF